MEAKENPEKQCCDTGTGVAAQDPEKQCSDAGTGRHEGGTEVVCMASGMDTVCFEVDRGACMAKLE